MGKARKEDLRNLANELGLIFLPDDRIIDLKKLIINSKDYKEEFVKLVLESILNDRLKLEEQTLKLEEQTREREKEEGMLELEKLRLQSNASFNQAEIEAGVKSLNLQKLMYKFNMKEGDIGYYLVLFERHARRATVKNEDYVAHLLGLLPYEITQLIPREPEQSEMIMNMLNVCY